MKPLPGILISVCLFGLATVLAWRGGVSAEPDISARKSSPSAKAPSAAAAAAARRKEVIARCERELLHGPDPSTETYSAAGMEHLIRDCRGILDGDQAVYNYLEQWADQDPAAAAAWLDRRGLTSSFAIFFDDMKTTRVFRPWAEKDLEAALAAARGLTFPNRRAQALITTLQALAKSDPDRARSIFAQHLDLFATVRDLSLDYNYYDNGASVLEFLGSLPPGKARGNLLATFLNFLDSSRTPATSAAFWNKAAENVKQDLVLAGYAPSPIKGELATSTENEPPAESLPAFPGLEDRLRRKAESTGNGGDAYTFFKSFGNDWAARNPAAALAWAQTHLKGLHRLDSSVEVFVSAAAQNFDAAVTTWQSLPPGVLKSKAAGALVVGAPGDRKPEAQALMETLSPYDFAKAQESTAFLKPKK